MIAGLTPDDIRRLQIFHPLAFEKTMWSIQTKNRFVHYASAHVALEIINRGQVWMRRASAMNDFREIDYGRECLLEAYHGESGKRLQELLEANFAGICKELAVLFDGWYPHFATDTFLTCISEHDPSEDTLGRLSMWRAYGGPVGVAIVLNGAIFTSASDALRAYTSPVAYLSQAQFQQQFIRLVDNIEKNLDFVRHIGHQEVLSSLMHAFHMAVICTKHPGFHEEREWRVIYNPTYNRSARIIQAIETIAGVPQIVQKIPLVDVPEEGLVGLAPAEFIDRVIIGPTDFPWQVRDAFVLRMAEIGIPDVEKKVIVSDIPLRR